MCFGDRSVTINAWCTHCHDYHIGMGKSLEAAGLDLRRKQDCCRSKAMRMARATANSNRNAARWRTAFENAETK